MTAIVRKALRTLFFVVDEMRIVFVVYLYVLCDLYHNIEVEKQKEHLLELSS